MRLSIDTKDYIVREVSIEVDPEGFLQSHVRIYHKEQNPIEAKIYKYAVKLGVDKELENLVGTRVSFSSQLGETK